MRPDADRPCAPRPATGADGRPIRHLVVALLLTWTAGFLDAIGYTHLAGLYVSFMSGNSTRLGIAIFQGDRQILLPCALVIMSFVAGAFAGSLISDTGGRFKLVMILAVEIVLLLSAIALSWHIDGYAGLLPICVAMGAQNAAHETIAGAELGKSFITGFLFNLGKTLAQLARGRGGGAQAFAYGMSWAAFLAGVMLGSLALLHLGLAVAISIACLLLGSLMIGAMLDQLWRSRPVLGPSGRAGGP